MDINQLRSFKAVAQSKSISEAAKKLFISHQALSKTVSSLEAELGVPLLDRGPGGVSLTPYGDLALQTAKDVEQSLALLTRKIELMQKADQANVRLGFSISLLEDELLIKGLVRSCRESQVHLTCMHLGDDDLLAQVASMEIDMGIAVLAKPPSKPGLVALGLCPVPHYLTIDVDVPFAHGRDLAPEDLLLLTLPYRDDATREVVRTAFAHAAAVDEPRLAAYDPSATDFSSHLHTSCNAAYVDAAFVEAARSGSHSVRPFPPDGWTPTAYLVYLKDRAGEKALLAARKAVVSNRDGLAHFLDPATTVNYLS